MVGVSCRGLRVIEVGLVGTQGLELRVGMFRLIPTVLNRDSNARNPQP